MPYVVTFEDYRPAPRYAPATGAWTTVQIQEAEAQAGPWTTVETVTLDPVDTDPEHPRHRDLSTDSATLAEGWYRLVWVDGDGNTQPSTPIQNTQGAVSVSWAPSVQDVADLSPAYTRHPVGSEGQQAGAEHHVFDNTTDPTDTEVEGLINSAVREVMGRTGASVSRLELFADLAKQTAAWHAAASIEAEKAPAAADEIVGAYAWKQVSYVACLNSLIDQTRMPLLK